MSADRIGLCPKCNEYRLKEYMDLAFQKIGAEWIFVFDVSTVCNYCNFSWSTKIEKVVGNIED